MTRAWSLALPIVTVLVVAYALLFAGVPRNAIGARVYGGPTEGQSTLSLRVESVQRDGEHESPYWDGPLTVSASSAGISAGHARVGSSLNGVVDVTLPFVHAIHGPVRLELRGASGVLLANGDIALDNERWAARARRRGGWIRGRANDSLVVSIAPERGAFVIGSTDSLLIRVERASNAAPGVDLNVKAEGAELSGLEHLRTDARGRAQIGFRAVDLNPTLRVEARSESAESGLIDSGVPVVAGGLHAIRTLSGFRVDSATPRREVYFSVVSDDARLSGGALKLTPDSSGGAFATAELPRIPAPSWLVVSSEVDLNSAAAIGWPLDSTMVPAQTFDVPDALLLDGLPAAFEREQVRRSRVRWLTAAFIAVAFALSVALLVLRVRAADRNIAQHLRAELELDTAQRIAPRGLWPLLVALLAIGLGFIALGLIVVARSH
jgi:hypothetical protein